MGSAASPVGTKTTMPWRARVRRTRYAFTRYLLRSGLLIVFQPGRNGVSLDLLTCGEPRLAVSACRISDFRNLHVKGQGQS